MAEQTSSFIPRLAGSEFKVREYFCKVKPQQEGTLIVCGAPSTAQGASQQPSGSAHALPLP